ncbi:hypothetical protein EXN66_Car010088 [Channa argus]|uniref:Uncharacterized protein n=1 Tax=Channa argus TaxID=215402 RepID=A0A6G1PVX7_CHAAH|nr:hypothetical protein EXN66_Car010088 [Channa argus]
MPSDALPPLSWTSTDCILSLAQRSEVAALSPGPWIVWEIMKKRIKKIHINSLSGE